MQKDIKTPPPELQLHFHEAGHVITGIYSDFDLPVAGAYLRLPGSMRLRDYFHGNAGWVEFEKKAGMRKFPRNKDVVFGEMITRQGGIAAEQALYNDYFAEMRVNVAGDVNATKRLGQEYFLYSDETPVLTSVEKLYASLHEKRTNTLLEQFMRFLIIEKRVSNLSMEDRIHLNHEVDKLYYSANEQAKKIILEHKDELEVIAKELDKKSYLSGTEIYTKLGIPKPSW